MLLVVVVTALVLATMEDVAVDNALVNDDSPLPIVAVFVGALDVLIDELGAPNEKFKADPKAEVEVTALVAGVVIKLVVAVVADGFELKLKFKGLVACVALLVDVDVLPRPNPLKLKAPPVLAAGVAAVDVAAGLLPKLNEKADPVDGATEVAGAGFEPNVNPPKGVAEGAPNPNPPPEAVVVVEAAIDEAGAAKPNPVLGAKLVVGAANAFALNKLPPAAVVTGAAGVVAPKALAPLNAKPVADG